MEENNALATQQTTENTGVVALSGTSMGLDSFDYAKKIASLTPVQREEYLKKAQSLNVKDSNSIMTYGAEVSSLVARNGDVLLNSVKATNNVEIVKYINDLLGELNGFEDDMNRYTGTHGSALKRFFYSLPGIKKVATSLETVMNQYNSVSENVDKIATKISTSKTVAIRDNSTLEQIFENNMEYIGQLRDLIIAAKLEDENITMQLEKMYNEGAETIEIQKLTNFQTRLRKRIEDLQTNAYVFYQNLFQIEAIKENNNALIEQSNNIVTHVIPIWKSQLPLAIIMKNQATAADANALIKETTNKLILKTSEDILDQSKRIAAMSEQSTIDIATLQKSTQNLVSTITAVRDEHKKGAKQREEFENALQKMCDDINRAATTGI